MIKLHLRKQEINHLYKSDGRLSHFLFNQIVGSWSSGETFWVSSFNTIHKDDSERNLGREIEQYAVLMWTFNIIFYENDSLDPKRKDVDTKYKLVEDEL